MSEQTVSRHSHAKLLTLNAGYFHVIVKRKLSTFIISSSTLSHPWLSPPSAQGSTFQLAIQWQSFRFRVFRAQSCLRYFHVKTTVARNVMWYMKTFVTGDLLAREQEFFCYACFCQQSTSIRCDANSCHRQIFISTLCN